MAGNINPGMLFDANPEMEVNTEPGLANDDLADTVEYADLHLARAHASTNIEFYSALVQSGVSTRFLRFDASRKKLTILSATFGGGGTGTMQPVLSTHDLSAVFNPAGYTAANPGFPFPGMVLANAFTPVVIETRDELWLYGLNAPGSTTYGFISYAVERYSSGV